MENPNTYSKYIRKKHERKKNLGKKNPILNLQDKNMKNKIK
jgi:hypothetical protein